MTAMLARVFVQTAGDGPSVATGRRRQSGWPRLGARGSCAERDLHRRLNIGIASCCRDGDERARPFPAGRSFRQVQHDGASRFLIALVRSAPELKISVGCVLVLPGRRQARSRGQIGQPRPMPPRMPGIATGPLAPVWAGDGPPRASATDSAHQVTPATLSHQVTPQIDNRHAAKRPRF